MIVKHSQKEIKNRKTFNFLQKAFRHVHLKAFIYIIEMMELRAFFFIKSFTF